MDERGRPYVTSATIFYRLATVVMVVAVLYFLSAVLLPFALAVLLTFMLTPVVRRLERWGLGRVMAVIVVSVGLTVIAGLGVIAMGGQLVSLTNELPSYRRNISEKLASARDLFSPVLTRLESSSEYIDRLVQGLAPEEEAVREAHPTDEPSPQKAEPLPAGPDQPSPARRRLLADVVNWLGPILSPLGTASVVAVFTIFMLIEREDLRNRLIVLLGVDRVPGTTQLLDEAVRRVSRYLRMQLTINLIYGFALAILSLAVGLPQAMLWGAMGTVLRFIPYFGPVLAAGFPLAVAVAVTHGWTSFLILAAGILVIELIVNNFLEPWLYGNSVGVSPLGILVSAFFWAWLWGIPGLILATPLTAVITVLARHIPALGWLATLLGDDPPLAGEDQLYQRLLAGDTHESLRVAESLVTADDKDALNACAPLLLVLQRATADVASGALKRHQLTDLLSSYGEVIDDLVDDLRPAEEAGLETGRVVCLPGRGAGNAEAAEVTALALSRAGWDAHAASAAGLTSELVREGAEPDVVGAAVISIGPRALSHARYVLRSFQSAGGRGAHALIIRPQSLLEGDVTELKRLGATSVAATLGELDANLRAHLASTGAQHASRPADVNLPVSASAID